MPRDERVFVVFVASPSDMEQERECLEEVIRELNLTWSRTLGIRLDLVRWQTHGYPGFGTDAQDVLNRELSDDPDIFIGLLWVRYGTPTGRAGSGTEEEFQRALDRFRQDSTSIKIMIYFKDAPLAPSQIDPNQLAHVRRFQSSLGNEGGLYWNFGEIDEFEGLVRIHLARQMQEFSNKPRGGAISDAAAQIDSADTSSEAIEELGLIDYLDLVDEHFGSLIEITERISDETTIFGQRMQERTKEVNKAIAEAPQGQLSRHEARTLIGKAAGDMNDYVTQMRTELPTFDDLLQRGAEAAGRVALIAVEIAPEGKTKVIIARQQLAEMRDALSAAFDGMVSFRNSIQGMPRMTVVLNRAKRETTNVIQQVIDSMDSGRRVLTEAMRALDSLAGEDSIEL